MDASRARKLTPGEVALARTIFGEQLDYQRVQIFRRKAYFFQPADRAMAPDGHVYFHPRDPRYRDDFSEAGAELQRLFIHELTHVWQAQHGVHVRLRGIVQRRYEYASVDARRPFHRYGLEQQAQMVGDYFALVRHGLEFATTAREVSRYDVLPFRYRA